MEDPLLIYEIFNKVEGIIWVIIALSLPFFVRAISARQRFSIAAASVGFTLFGVSDFIEAPLRGQRPSWLWAFKIPCAAWILSCRFFYLGWDRFRFNDRYVILGLECLLASAVAISLQHSLYDP